MATLALTLAHVKARIKSRVESHTSDLSYKLRHWGFQWKQDEEGDIALVVLRFIALVKYKEHTIIRFDGHKMVDAPRYLVADE